MALLLVSTSASIHSLPSYMFETSYLLQSSIYVHNHIKCEDLYFVIGTKLANPQFSLFGKNMHSELTCEESVSPISGRVALYMYNSVFPCSWHHPVFLYTPVADQVGRELKCHSRTKYKKKVWAI